jgi:hypothetical protein
MGRSWHQLSLEPLHTVLHPWDIPCYKEDPLESRKVSKVRASHYLFSLSHESLDRLIYLVATQIHHRFESFPFTLSSYAPWACDGPIPEEIYPLGVPPG